MALLALWREEGFLFMPQSDVDWSIRNHLTVDNHAPDNGRRLFGNPEAKTWCIRSLDLAVGV